MSNRVILRTHGGLGNQIFQVFYAMTKYEKEIFICHDDRYKHGFKLSPLLAKSFPLSSSKFESVLSRSRVVKIIEKINNDAQAKLKILNWIFLDGYFQKHHFYDDVDLKKLIIAFDTLKKLFLIEDNKEHEFLAHIRLYDFFECNEDRLVSARDRLSKLKKGVHFVTTDDKLVSGDKICQDIIKSGSLCHINTTDFHAEDMLRLMTKFKTIESNNSTLAFWAALFSNSNLIVQDENLSTLFRKIKTYINE